MFTILSGYLSTSAYIDAVRTASDQNREALGFFAGSVFAEFAQRDQLYVLVASERGEQRYAGHLLFDCRFPRAVVRQIFVLPEFNHKGGARTLIERLKADLAKLGFSSIYARVAADLSSANTFWQKQGFRVQRVEPGGATRNRKILVRCHELPSRQLFPASGVDDGNPLGLMLSPSVELPLYLVDLNVLYDLGPRRLRHSEAAGLFSAERMNFCRLAISKELGDELSRTALQGRTDPMADYIRIYPAFPLTSGPRTDGLLMDLAATIFPRRPIAVSLSETERSDLRHVATAIEHRLAGFITNDTAVLNAASAIHQRYGIQVVSPAAFQTANAHSASRIDFEIPSADPLRLLPIAPGESTRVHELLTNVGLSGSAISSGWLPPDPSSGLAHSYGVWSDESLVGYLTWSSGKALQATIARVAVKETESQALNAARILLLYLIEQLGSQGPKQLHIELPLRQSYVREFANGLGFTRASATSLRKVMLGRVVAAHNWQECRDDLLKAVGLKLPADAPPFQGIEQQIAILTPDGNMVHLDIDALESLLSPALFVLAGRPAVITPVRREFSEPLLGHSPQFSLLPRGTASLFKERHYISGSSTFKRLARGTTMLLYESTRDEGRGALVAIARVRDSYLKPADALSGPDLDASVLNRRMLARIGQAKLKTVTAFDNVFCLPSPVPLRTLQKVGCGRPNDLITTRPISDTQLQRILREALP